MIVNGGGDNDDLDIRCVGAGGAVLDVIVEFRRREQLLIVRSEKGGCFSNLGRVGDLAKACRKEEPTLLERGPVPKILYCVSAFKSLKVLVKSYGFEKLKEMPSFSLRRKANMGWSARLAPTPGESMRTGILYLLRTDAGPMPESMRIWGVCTAPPL